MSLPDKAFPVSWDQFHRDARALAWRLAGMEFSAMVAVTRGGLVPAAIIARELGHGLGIAHRVAAEFHHDDRAGIALQIGQGLGQGPRRGDPVSVHVLLSHRAIRGAQALFVASCGAPTKAQGVAFLPGARVGWPQTGGAP